MAGTDHGKRNGRLILGWGDIFILSLLITLCGALGFSVSTYLHNRPANVTPVVNPLADQFEQLLVDNFIPRQNIRLVREDTVISGKERYNVRTYEIQLPDTINWPGLRRLLVEALARKQVTLVESASEPKSGQYRVTLSLGRCPFVEAVFNAAENRTVSGPNCEELMDVARQAMLAVGVISGAITMEPEHQAEDTTEAFSVHLPSGIDILKIENALADAISPFDGFLEVLEEKPDGRVIRMSLMSGPCATLRLMPEPASSNATPDTASSPPDGTSPASVEPVSAPEHPVEQTAPASSSGETSAAKLSQTRWEHPGHAFLNLVSPSVLLGSLSIAPPDTIPPEEPETLSENLPLPVAGDDPTSDVSGSEPELNTPLSEPAETPQETYSVLAGPQPVMRPRVAIILDDGGWGSWETEEILAMDSRLTLSILPNTPYGTETAQRGLELGFEIMLHMPMQNGRSHFPGELRTDMNAATIRELTLQAVNQVPGACGANNHTGTTFTRNRPGMEAFMDVMVELGWFFVDSRTIPNSVAYTVAMEKGVPALNREIFLDHENTPTYINRQFRSLITLARKNGRALAIGHFRSNTVRALKVWIPELEKEDIDLVHVSELLP